MNAFHIAVENCHLDITAMLLDAKPDLIHTKRNVRDVHLNYCRHFFPSKKGVEVNCNSITFISPVDSAYFFNQFRHYFNFPEFVMI